MGIVAAFGTTLTIAGVPISGIQDITGPGDTFDWWDGTSHSSANRTEEGVPTIRRTGEVSFTLVLDSTDAGQQALLAAHEAIVSGTHDPDAFVQTYPDGSSDTYDGYVMGFSRGAPVGGGLTADVTIRPTGAIDYTPAAS